MDKLCATCGKQLQADQGFCDQCGSAWAPRAEGTAIPAGPVITPVAVAVQPPARSSNKTLMFLSIIAIIAVVTGGWFFMTHRALAASPDAATAVTSTSVTTTVNTAATVVPTSSSAEGAPAVPQVTDSISTAPGESAIAAATAAASSKQCSLITRAEMESILGAKIVKLTATEQTCAYFTDADRSVQVETIWSGAKEALAVTKGFNNSEDLFKPIPGIGDEAYFQAGGVLHVLKGNAYIVVNSREYPNELEIESAIARKIVANLK